MVREALTGAWSLVSGLTGAVRTAVAGPPDEVVRLQERVRELERQVAALRAATDALGRRPGAAS
jgi:hypothetical protein